LVSKLNPRIFRAWTVFEPKDGRHIASTEFIVYEVRRDAYWSFVNSLLRSDEIISSFRQHVTGTSGSHQRVKPESTLSIPIVIPSEQLLDTFNEIIAPSYSLSQVHIDQIQSLSQIRDALLPRLISGKLQVTI
jgi:type I restriction enzyme S subunit